VQMPPKLYRILHCCFDGILFFAQNLTAFNYYMNWYFCPFLSVLVCVKSQLAQCRNYVLYGRSSCLSPSISQQGWWKCTKFEGADKSTHRIPRNLAVVRIKSWVPSDTCCYLWCEIWVAQPVHLPPKSSTIFRCHFSAVFSSKSKYFLSL